MQKVFNLFISFSFYVLQSFDPSSSIWLIYNQNVDIIFKKNNLIQIKTKLKHI